MRNSKELMLIILMISSFQFDRAKVPEDERSDWKTGKSDNC